MAPDLPALARTLARTVVGIGRGSGVAVAPDVVLTAGHNLGHHDPGGSVEVHLADGRTVTGTLLAAAADHDLAAIRVAADLQPLPTADPPDVGAAVVAAAAPGGTLRVTAGTVAATGTRLHTRTGSPVDGLVEHTAPLPRGASGGPVVDAEGRLVAVDLNRIAGGLYQAVPVTGPIGSSVIERLAVGEVPARWRLGVAVSPTRRARRLREAVGLPALDGVLVTAAEADGPAAAAGIDRGDTITAVGATPVRTPDELLLALRGTDGTAELTVVRGADAPRQVSVRLQAA